MWWLQAIFFGTALVAVPLLLTRTRGMGMRRSGLAIPVMDCPHCHKQTRVERTPDSGDQDPVNECQHCHRRFRPSDPVDSDDQALVGLRAKPGPQVVGQPCAVCGKRVIFDTEAEPCPTCDKVVHLDCLPHRHATAAGTPYRD
jgi:hypothetical protein